MSASLSKKLYIPTRSNQCVPCSKPWKGWGCLEVFRNPSITRGTLTVDFQFVSADRHYCVNPPSSRVRALGRFVNFRTIELQCSHVGAGTKDLDPARNHTYPRARARGFQTALEPVLGFGEDCIREGKHQLRFHPIGHRNRLRQPDHGNRGRFFRRNWSGMN